METHYFDQPMRYTAHIHQSKYTTMFLTFLKLYHKFVNLNKNYRVAFVLFQGLFSRITFAQPVVLAGTGHFRNTDHFLEMDAGFSGCIRNLEINNKMYNFNTVDNGGDVIQGIDIGESKAASHDRINLTRMGLESDRKSMTMKNQNG